LVAGNRSAISFRINTNSQCVDAMTSDLVHLGWAERREQLIDGSSLFIADERHSSNGVPTRHTALAILGL